MSDTFLKRLLAPSSTFSPRSCNPPSFRLLWTQPPTQILSSRHFKKLQLGKRASSTEELSIPLSSFSQLIGKRERSWEKVRIETLWKASNSKYHIDLLPLTPSWLCWWASPPECSLSMFTQCQVLSRAVLENFDSTKGERLVETFFLKRQTTLKSRLREKSTAWKLGKVRVQDPWKAMTTYTSLLARAWWRSLSSFKGGGSLPLFNSFLTCL